MISLMHDAQRIATPFALFTLPPDHLPLSSTLLVVFPLACPKKALSRFHSESRARA